jgi:hypothetical protein
MQEADNIQQVLWLGYEENTPKHFYNRYNFGGNIFTGWNFAGQSIYKGFNFNGRIQFKNYLSIFTGGHLQGSSLSASDLRGGPMLKLPGGLTYRIGFNSDERKKLQAEIFLMKNWGRYDNSSMGLIELSLSYKPVNIISISLSPSYNVGYENLQYVTTIDNGQENYIMASLDSKQFALSARINLSMTPNMSLQYYGQPFFFEGIYTEFKTITNSVATDYYDRFHVYTSSEITYDSESAMYTVDTDGNGEDFSFENPNFHFSQFRSNLVYRWEYRPGSTFFLVWSQGRTANGTEGNLPYDDYMNELSSAHPQNDFMIKISYALIF